MNRYTLCLGLIILLVTVLTSCGGSSEKANIPNNVSALSNKERQYFTNGQQLYQTLCVSCHMVSGEGLGKLIPPLKNSDYLLANVPGAARIIKYGMKGPMMVNNVEYNQPMPANSRLTNLEIVELLTYISNNWGNEHGAVTLAEVAESLKEKAD